MRLLNASLGVSGQLGTSWAVAVGIGAFTADGDSDPTSFDTNALYLKAATGCQFKAFRVEMDIGIGFPSNGMTHEITGSSGAKSERDSILYTAGLRVEQLFCLQGNLDLLGFGSVRYTLQDDDGYTETSALDSAIVGDVTTEIFEVRLGREVEKLPGIGRIIPYG